MPGLRRLFTVFCCLAAPALAEPVDIPSLSDAILAGDVAALRMAAAGADIDEPIPPAMLTPLALAALRGEVGMVAALLKAGADPDARWAGRPAPLSAAIRSCRAGPEVVAALIAAGTDLEQRSGAELTPLLLAIQEERTQIALMLIEAGADVNALTPHGDGTLNYAIYTSNPALVQALLERDVDLAPLRVLFTTVDYDPPGIKGVAPHHAVICR